MAIAAPKVVGYVRTSTEDREQNPERQRDVITAWAQREGVEVVTVVVDEGTSGSKVAPMARPKFAECIAAARAANATAIVVEAQDRFTRADAEGFFVYRYLLRQEYGLQLWSCAMGVSQQGKTEGRLMAVMSAESSAAWVQRHSQAVASGMARAKAEGRHMGRPAKPPLTDEEYAWAATILAEGDERDGPGLRARQRHGTGLRAAAHAISRHRGADDAHDPQTRRKRAVSARWLERQMGKRGWCRECWWRGRRDRRGDFHPDTCPAHQPHVVCAAPFAA